MPLRRRSYDIVHLLLKQAKVQVEQAKRQRSRRLALVILDWSQCEGDRGNIASALGRSLARKHKCKVRRWRRFEYELDFDGDAQYERGIPELVTRWAEIQFDDAKHQLLSGGRIDIHGMTFPVAPSQHLMQRTAAVFCEFLSSRCNCSASLAYFGALRWTIDVRYD
jgi:hypothetical protein